MGTYALKWYTEKAKYDRRVGYFSDLLGYNALRKSSEVVGQDLGGVLNPSSGAGNNDNANYI
jgi:hypothetical protein